MSDPDIWAVDVTGLNLREDPYFSEVQGDWDDERLQKLRDRWEGPHGIPGAFVSLDDIPPERMHLYFANPWYPDEKTAAGEELRTFMLPVTGDERDWDHDAWLFDGEENSLYYQPQSHHFDMIEHINSINPEAGDRIFNDINQGGQVWVGDCLNGMIGSAIALDTGQRVSTIPSEVHRAILDLYQEHKRVRPENMPEKAPGARFAWKRVAIDLQGIELAEPAGIWADNDE